MGGYVSVAKVQESQVVMLKNDSAHERLTQVIKQAPNREWIDQYLELVKELIEFAELENDDPRLQERSPLNLECAFSGFGAVVFF